MGGLECRRTLDWSDALAATWLLAIAGGAVVAAGATGCSGAGVLRFVADWSGAGAGAVAEAGVAGATATEWLPG